MQRFYHILFLFTVFTTTACTKIVEIELEEEDRRLVVDAWFTTDEKVHEVRLTQTTGYFDDEPVPQVSGAQVSISGGGETFVFSEAEPGIYRSAPTAKASMHTTYTLKIEYDGQVYEATDYCDTVPLIDNMVPYPDYDEEGNLQDYDILIWTTELAGFGDYYAWRVMVNGEFVSDTLADMDFTSDDYIDDGLYFEAWPITEVHSLYSGDTLRLEQHNISKNTYDAFLAVMLETDWRGGIFDAPPSNVPTNLTNGALGLFVVSSVADFEFIVP